MLEEILRIDTALFLYLNNIGNSSFDGFWSFREGGVEHFSQTKRLLKIQLFANIRKTSRFKRL